MAKILDAAQIRVIVTPNVKFDKGYFSDSNIEFAQEKYLEGIMTKDLYDDFIANLGSLPALYQTLFDDYIQYIVAYGSAVLSYKKDLTPQTDNQGVMSNNTQHSAQAQRETIKGMLMQLDDRLFYYRECLAAYLLENEADYPLFDSDASEMYIEQRDYFKY